jgi:hypothetical protein
MVQFADPETCPRWSELDLTRLEPGFGRATPARDLECALMMLRKAGPFAIPHAVVASKACALLADEAKDPVTTERLASEGVRWGEAALSGGTEQEGAAHYWLAVNLGQAVRNHVALAITKLGRLESELSAAVRLAPEEDEGGPYRVIGRLYLMAPAWPQGIGDEDKAVETLALAVERFPDHPANHLDYARVLWEVEEEDALDTVRKHLDLADALLAKEAWGFSTGRWRKEVQQLRKEARLAK